MSLATTRYEHIVLDENGVPFVHATDLKVVELVLEQSAHGWSAEELHFQHPYLSLGQIHSATIPTALSAGMSRSGACLKIPSACPAPMTPARAEVASTLRNSCRQRGGNLPVGILPSYPQPQIGLLA